MNIETLRIELAEALDALEQTIDALCTGIRAETDYPTWGWRDEDPQAARLEASTMIRAIDYEPGQAANETRIYPALLGASAETCERAHSVNHAKIRLKQALDAMKDMTIEIDGEEKDLLRHALSFLGHLHLHYIQATRRIQVLEQKPYRVGYTWLTGSARIERTSRELELRKIRHNLERAGGLDAGLEEDLQRLLALPPGEPLARRRRALPHPRVNLVFKTRTENGEADTRRIPKPAVLPIIYPAQPGEPLPKMRRPLAPEPPTPGKPRRKPRRIKGVRVDNERYLITVPVHRYVKPPAMD